MIRRPPISTRTYTLFPYTTLFRSRITAGVSAVSSANGRSIEQAALGPQRVQPAIELYRAALAEMALEDLAIVADGGDHRDGPVVGEAALGAEVAGLPQQPLDLRVLRRLRLGCHVLLRVAELLGGDERIQHR